MVVVSKAQPCPWLERSTIKFMLRADSHLVPESHPQTKEHYSRQKSHVKDRCQTNQTQKRVENSSIQQRLQRQIVRLLNSPPRNKAKECPYCLKRQAHRQSKFCLVVVSRRNCCKLINWNKIFVTLQIVTITSTWSNRQNLQELSELLH